MANLASNREVRGRFYQPELDALRFVAFLGVLLHHKSNPRQLPAGGHLPLAALLWAMHIVGAYGVELFFLLSSYLITRLLLKEVDNTGRLDLRAFYIRRILRIWPLYFCFLLLCFAVQGHYNESVPLGFWIASCLFVTNWYLAHFTVWMPLSLLWTLSVEEQFYIVWPFLLRKGLRRQVMWVSIASIAVSQAAIIYLRLTGVDHHNPLFNNSFTEGQFFGLGGLLALWAEKRPVALTASKRVLVAIAGCACLALAAMFDPIHPTLSGGLLSYNLLFALIAAGVVALFRAFIGSPPHIYPRWILFLGRISYGLYLFNLFAVYVVFRALRGRISIWLELPIVVLVNIVLALLSSAIIEKPFLKLKSRFEVVRSRPVSMEATASEPAASALTAEGRRPAQEVPVA